MMKEIFESLPLHALHYKEKDRYMSSVFNLKKDINTICTVAISISLGKMWGALFIKCYLELT